ncbi:hypothetical protein OMCYN_00597 [cyanobiont of Ornithocercus magnificus]|nr:hypothetical protein OMCYN_00597 [cyanobiont of Ornithocercus magnificus]
MDNIVGAYPFLYGSTVSGALLWALALYLPLSVPLNQLEVSLTKSFLKESWQQLFLTISSLLLALVVGLAVQLLLSWALGPGWAASLGIIAIGWELLLALSGDNSGSV